MIRSSQLYITRGTRRMLSVIARAEGGESSADAVGERLLSETLTTRYPALALIQKEIEALEEKMVESVRK
jgi:hypothetical protein